MTDFSEETRTLSMFDVLKATLRHWLLIPALLALGVVAGLAILSMAKPTYQSTAKILLERRDIPYKEGNDASSADKGAVIDERYVESQVAVMGSADFAKTIVDKLDLATKRGAQKSAGMLKSVLIGWGFADDKSKLSPDQAATAEVQDAITVFSTPQSNVINVRVTAQDAQGAADMANALVDAYVTSVTGDDNPAQARVRDWLSSQITELRKKVAESEGAAERFRSNAGLLKGTNSTLGTEQISAINAQLSAAEAAETEAVAKAKAVKALMGQRGSVDSASEVMNSPVIQQLQQQRISANRVVSELGATYLSNHPKLIAARQQVAEIDKQIRSESLKIVEGLDSQAQLATARTKSLRASLEQLKGTESTANIEEIQLNALERDATANRQLLETLLARYVDINTRQDLDVKPTSARVIQKAVAPAFVSYPRKGPILLLTSLAGLALGLGLAFVYEITKAAGGQAAKSPRTRSVEKVQSEDGWSKPAMRPAQHVHVPVPVIAPQQLAAAPAQPFQSEPPPVFTASVAPAVMESATSTATSVPVVQSDSGIAGELQRFRKSGVAANAAFARVGCGPRESAMAVVAAARELANAGNRCLVIDLDMERAELERLFELPDGPGLLDLLAGRSDFNRLICRDALSTVQIIRLGDPANAPAMETLVARLQSILKSLQGIYDFILVHTGKGSADSLALVTLADVAIVVSPPSHDADTVSFMQTLRTKSPMEVINLAVEDAALAGVA